jgi:hypothetical protein
VVAGNARRTGHGGGWALPCRLLHQPLLASSSHYRITSDHTYFSCSCMHPLHHSKCNSLLLAS